jgi:membrane protein DedA with SNARE-associated domain
VVGRPAALWLLGERELEEAERLFRRVGGWVVAVSRWIPIVSEAVACLAGLAGMPLRAFGLALFSGVVPLGLVVASLGYAGSDRPILTLVLCALLPLPIWYSAKAKLVPPD